MFDRVINRAFTFIVGFLAILIAIGAGRDLLYEICGEILVAFHGTCQQV